jgi:hypothetical protein
METAQHQYIADVEATDRLRAEVTPYPENGS